MKGYIAWFCAAGLIVASSAADARQVVRINGYTIVCQNTCRVSVGPAGEIQVVDTGGGWVAIYTPNGHLPVEK
jgi:hypothetical protein